MNKIQYNEKEEAYEIQYKIWEKEITIRFYVEDQQDIMDNFSEIAQKLDKLNREKEQIVGVVTDNGFYEGSADSLVKAIGIEKAYVDIDEDGVVVCFSVSSSDGYLVNDTIAMELYGDEFEAIGYGD